MHNRQTIQAMIRVFYLSFPFIAAKLIILLTTRIFMLVLWYDEIKNDYSLRRILTKNNCFMHNKSKDYKTLLSMFQSRRRNMLSFI